MTKETIPYVNIWIEDGDLNFTANDEGYFRIRHLNDKKAMVLSAVGYRNKTFRINEVRDIVLVPYIISLEETVVIAPSKERKKRVLIDKIKRNKIGYY